MTDGPPPLLSVYHRLRFSCACCSAVPISEDPSVAIVNQRKLNDGTKELILDAIYRQPRTITQLAELLGISAPAVHRHAGEMLACELISEVGVTAPERSRASERIRPHEPARPRRIRRHAALIYVRHSDPPGPGAAGSGQGAGRMALARGWPSLGLGGRGAAGIGGL